MSTENSQLHFHTCKVLIAEDNVMNQKILKALLRKEGYEASVVANGKEALLALEEHSFNILILDYQMPELDGFQTLQIIRAHSNNHIRQIPVIFLTAEVNQETLRQIENSGVFQILQKPIDPKKLMGALTQVKNAPTQVSQIKDNRYTEYLYSITDGNVTLMVELIDIFMEEAPSAIQKMKAAFADKDFSALLKTIHKIRSNYKYVGMLEGEKMLEELEKDVEINTNLDSYINRINVIEQITISFLQTLTSQKKQLQDS